MLDLSDLKEVGQKLCGVVNRTPLVYSRNLSQKYGCEVYLKREDLQAVRSYKIRGAYNKISSLTLEERKRGVVCASAGNHAQGVAYSCNHRQIKGVIFMPIATPQQKIMQVKHFGQDMVELVISGETFDDCQLEALEFAKERGLAFVSPFDDHKVIEGQATVGLEIWEDLPDLDLVFLPVGGGGLASGVGTFLKKQNPKIEVVGVEPDGAASMCEAFKANQPVTLSEIDKFIDGAAVKRVGKLTYSICKKSLDKMYSVPEGRVCSWILKLYNEEGIVVEPAGALSLAALDFYPNDLKGKKVVCVISGGNNDIERMSEIKERSLLHEGLKHYFIIRFSQRAGALKEFVNHALGENDDITRFEYLKKNARNMGPALVGVELREQADYEKLIKRMTKLKVDFTEINQQQNLFELLL